MRLCSGGGGQRDGVLRRRYFPEGNTARDGRSFININQVQAAHWTGGNTSRWHTLVEVIPAQVALGIYPRMGICLGGIIGTCPGAVPATGTLAGVYVNDAIRAHCTGIGGADTHAAGMDAVVACQ